MRRYLVEVCRTRKNPPGSQDRGSQQAPSGSFLCNDGVYPPPRTTRQLIPQRTHPHSAAASYPPHMTTFALTKCSSIAGTRPVSILQPATVDLITENHLLQALQDPAPSPIRNCPVANQPVAYHRPQRPPHALTKEAESRARNLIRPLP